MMSFIMGINDSFENRDDYWVLEEKVNLMVKRFAEVSERLFYRDDFRDNIDNFLDKFYNAWQKEGYFLWNFFNYKS